MYARVVRFEGGDPAALDKETEAIGRDIDAAKRGEPGTHSEELVKTVSRMVALVDHKSGSSAMIIFCDTKEDLLRVDRTFDAMTPSTDTGRRVSVDLYEVALDETIARAKAA